MNAMGKQMLLEMIEKHKHTERCFEYAARTAADHGNAYCIAKCADSHRNLIRLFKELVQTDVEIQDKIVKLREENRILQRTVDVQSIAIKGENSVDG